MANDDEAPDRRAGHRDQHGVTHEHDTQNPVAFAMNFRGRRVKKGVRVRLKRELTGARVPPSSLSDGAVYAFHLMEQPIDGVCCRGPAPVAAISFIAWNSSRRTPAPAGSRSLASRRPRYCSLRSALKPKKSGVQAAS